MARYYASNSPYLLDYLASVKTREEIEADPKLCQLLENPYIKDNVEVALEYAEAKRGGYEEKKAFIECYLANGPELDTHTLMHYREIILSDPTLREISSTITSNMSNIDTVRSTKFNKTNSDNNCFKNPCNYLSDISGGLMLPYNYKNYGNLANFWAMYFKSLFGMGVPDSEGKLQNGKEVRKKIGEDLWNYYTGPVLNDFTMQLHPTMQNGYNMICAVTRQQLKDLGTSIAKVAPQLGKWVSGNAGDDTIIEQVEKVSANVRTNLYTQLGDCRRLMEYMRKWNPHDLSMNNKGYVNTIAQKGVDGRPVDGQITEQTTNDKASENIKATQKQKSSSESTSSSSKDTASTSTSTSTSNSNYDAATEIMQNYQATINPGMHIYGASASSGGSTIGSSELVSTTVFGASSNSSSGNSSVLTSIQVAGF